jgi:hypothetical protein
VSTSAALDSASSASSCGKEAKQTPQPANSAASLVAQASPDITSDEVSRGSPDESSARVTKAA